MRRSFSSATNWDFTKPWRAPGPMTSAELAAKTGTTERYVREWLAAQAAGGLVTYDAATQKIHVASRAGFRARRRNEPGVSARRLLHHFGLPERRAQDHRAFRNGNGVGWHEHDPCLFAGTERFFRPNYRAHLIDEWIPALDGRRGEAESGRARRRRGLRSGHFDDPDGAGLSRNPLSSASITIRNRSSWRARPRAKPASRTA